MDEWPFRRWRVIGYDTTRLNQLPGTRSWNLCIVINRCQTLTGGNAISNFLVQHNSDSWIDRIFLALTPATENHAGTANPLALHGCEISGCRT